MWVWMRVWCVVWCGGGVGGVGDVLLLWFHGGGSTRRSRTGLRRSLTGKSPECPPSDPSLETERSAHMKTLKLENEIGERKVCRTSSRRNTMTWSCLCVSDSSQCLVPFSHLLLPLPPHLLPPSHHLLPPPTPTTHTHTHLPPPTPTTTHTHDHQTHHPPHPHPPHDDAAVVWCKVCCCSATHVGGTDERSAERHVWT